ncbi:hypothetical protein QBC40DRAFT_328341 [Triangularia verruculosa]|uniref:Uncharacterized protein n=1 Tax=Triangularia verruculosa TaxID=2587418 RepID=A0AAN6XFI7_9PEZI|nr:hypothetical protein QBC40DRAFT_328341 [Triangularia verruculosa]
MFGSQAARRNAAASFGQVTALTPRPRGSYTCTSACVGEERWSSPLKWCTYTAEPEMVSPRLLSTQSSADNTSPYLWKSSAMAPWKGPGQRGGRIHWLATAAHRPGETRGVPRTDPRTTAAPASRCPARVGVGISVFRLNSPPNEACTRCSLHGISVDGDKDPRPQQTDIPTSSAAHAKSGGLGDCADASIGSHQCLSGRLAVKWSCKSPCSNHTSLIGVLYVHGICKMIR